MGEKVKMRKHYAESKNYRATARAFKCNESVVRGICNQAQPERNNKGQIIGGANAHRNKKRGGRSITYPKTIEDELLQWIYTMNDQHLPVSVKLLSKKAKLLITPYQPTFKANHGCYEKFLQRNDLSLRKRTSLSQKLPQQLESKISTFYAQCGKAIKIGKYPLDLIGNMDETPLWFDIVPQRSIVKKGTKSLVIRTSGSEKIHLTVVLGVMADGNILPPMIIFKGKTDRTIRDLVVPEGFLVTTQEKAWMDEERMIMWLEEIWIKYTDQRIKSKKSLSFHVRF